MIMIADLPDDLESEILSRVPAKSLWELKATCKRWYALFRDPRFVEKNTRRGRWNTRLVVWNPCTGQRRKIKPRTRYRSEDRYALGYSTSSSSSSSGRRYKILKYWFYRTKQGVLVADCEIYELSSDSWKVLDSFTLDYSLYFNGMSLKGDTYWVAGHESGGADFFSMKFDFTAERLVRFLLPFQSFNLLDTKLLSVVRDEKLSVLHIDDMTDVMRIWVTNKIDDDEEDWQRLVVEE
ncbi:hypothetical protein Bca101_018910 [Brassica carinata]